MREREGEAVLRTRSPLAIAFMSRIIRHHAARRFHAVRLARDTAPVVPGAAPLVVYSNHPSWWDPMIFVLLQIHAFPGRIGFGPMEAAALGRYGVLRRIGVFPIEPSTRRGAAAFLDVSRTILARPGAILWVTAQGSFADVRARPLALRPGVAHLMRGVSGVVAVPLALEYTFWEESTPEALVRFGPLVAADDAGTVTGWEALLTDRLAATMAALAEDAISRDGAASRRCLPVASE